MAAHWPSLERKQAYPWTNYLVTTTLGHLVTFARPSLLDKSIFLSFYLPGARSTPPLFNALSETFTQYWSSVQSHCLLCRTVLFISFILPDCPYWGSSAFVSLTDIFSYRRFPFTFFNFSFCFALQVFPFNIFLSSFLLAMDSSIPYSSLFSTMTLANLQNTTDWKLTPASYFVNSRIENRRLSAQWRSPGRAWPIRMGFNVIFITLIWTAGISPASLS